MSETAQDAEQEPTAFIVDKGVCYASFGYDVGLSINLEEAERRITEITERKPIRHKRRAPHYFEFRPAPLRITSETEAIPLDTFQSHPMIEIVLYDFGAASVTYRIPFDGALSRLLVLSETLYDNVVLLADSRNRLESVLGHIAPTIEQPKTAPSVEDYLIFQIEAPTSMQIVTDICDKYSPQIAQILRSERQSLSAQEVRDATSCQISFGAEDVTLIDWNAALIVGSEMDDVRAVLEFANVELLEVRHLDRQLDDALNQAYDLVSEPMGRRLRLPGSFEFASRQIAQLQVDSAILFERVTNALKLLGDQYLARVYRLTSERFHLPTWSENILRKLQTLDSIYGKMTDRVASRRMELLEIAIVILIALSIAITFLPGMLGH